MAGPAASTTPAATGCLVISGGAGEIGSRVAGLLRSRGRQVVTWDRATPDETSGVHISCDITDTGQVAGALEETVARAGRIDSLVNAAGLGQFERFLDLSADDFRRIIDVNLHGPVNCMRAVLPGMLIHGSGSILNITSIWSTHAGPLRSAYIASKWGLLGVTKSLMEEFRATGIRICAVSPGPVVTKLSERMIPPSERHLWMTPEEAAEVVVGVMSVSGDQFVGSEIQAYGRARPSGLWHADLAGSVADS
jgi:NAD(P)-dependent dehydrogenase (short-subunit alcohol dehydrogenase family)